MNNGYIAVIDSGVGGISLLKKLIKVFPEEHFLYFGDSENLPYGNKDEKTLKDITFNNISYILSFNVKMIIVGCNTLSLTCLQFIKDISGVETYGVFPPVENFLLKGEKVLLLCTEKSADFYKNYKNLTVLALPKLAEDIDNNVFNLHCVNISNHLKNSFIKPNFLCKFDRVILGCTHYFFVKNKIFDHLRPPKILCAEDMTVKFLMRKYKNQKSLINNKRFKVLFIGKNKDKYEKFFYLSGQDD